MSTGNGAFAKGAVACVLDSTCQYLIPIDSLPQIILADGSGILAGPDPTNDGATWRQTFGTDGSGNQTFSAWVKQ